MKDQLTNVAAQYLRIARRRLRQNESVRAKALAARDLHRRLAL
jgi:hypothetical protein